MMWKHFAALACVLLCASPALCQDDPLAALHALADAAPRADNIEQMDLLIEMQHPTAPVAHAVEAAEAQPEHLETAFLGHESVVASLAGQDVELRQLGALSNSLAQKKHAVEAQRHAIEADEGKLQRLRRIIAENKQILMRNEQALASSSSQYLGAVKKYTTNVNQSVLKSLQATQSAAQKQAGGIRKATPDLKLDAEDDRAEQTVGGRSFVSVDSSAAIHAAQMAEAHLSAEHAAQFQRLVALKAQAVHQEYARDMAAHKAALPTTHQNEFAEFTKNLNLNMASEKQRTDSLVAAMHIERHDAPKVHHAPAPELSNEAQEEAQAAQVRAEMAGEPVTMFLELDTEAYASVVPDPVPGTPVDAKGLTKPKIEAGIVGLPEELPAPKPDLSKLAPCPADAPTPANPQTPPMTNLDKPPTSFLEVDAEDEAFAELDAELDSDADSEDAAAADVDADVEFTTEMDADLDAFVIAEGEMEQEQEQEQQAETEAETETEQQAESEVEQEAETEQEAEVEQEAEAEEEN